MAVAPIDRRLKAGAKGFFSITVNGNWRVVFRCVEHDVELVDCRDYHQDQATMSAMHDPAHPGEVLREYLPEGLSIGEVAKRLGVTRQAFSAVLNGRRRQRGDGAAPGGCAWHQRGAVARNAGQSRSPGGP
jgi:hypothetical protein